ncbi:Stf0 family sulfotransferase [Cognatiyoonia sp. IB215446]|uniref:Stf0 family sulfotransferase n=1 Tax=Cognatiyoonia sp. IB215446 TaxID=3097355 RepID=UPI0039B751BB
MALLFPGREIGLGRLEADFVPALFTYLHPQGRLDQAISRLRAERTGLWHKRADGTDLERQAAGCENRCDPNAVELATVAKSEHLWRAMETSHQTRIPPSSIARHGANAQMKWHEMNASGEL